MTQAAHTRLCAPQLLSKHSAAASISAVDLEYILRQIESDSGKLQHDRLPKWIVAIPPWHVDAVGGRLQHQSRASAVLPDGHDRKPVCGQGGLIDGLVVLRVIRLADPASDQLD